MAFDPVQHHHRLPFDWGRSPAPPEAGDGSEGYALPEPLVRSTVAIALRLTGGAPDPSVVPSPHTAWLVRGTLRMLARHPWRPAFVALRDRRVETRTRGPDGR